MERIKNAPITSYYDDRSIIKRISSTITNLMKSYIPKSQSKYSSKNSMDPIERGYWSGAINPDLPVKNDWRDLD